jgi:hypothetical protein
MPRFFTLEQAHRMLPRVEQQLRHAIQVKSHYDAAGKAIRDYQRRVQMMGGMLVDRHKLATMHSRVEALTSRLQELVEEIHGWGCLVKDLDTGLCDFPTLYRGREVYLCWRLGEEGISNWHPVEEGFRGRRPLDLDFLENHRGDAE